MSQEIMDATLDREHIIPVQISAAAPLPDNNEAYAPVRALQQTGLRITARELLHRRNGVKKEWGQVYV